ncbi:MAG: hemerythrin domain-containing protein [Candidatus Thorarchaeota archaeon]
MYPIDILLDEHKLIDRVFVIIEKVRDKLKDKEEIPAPVFWNLVEFIRGYADVIHHSKEEDILFDTLREHDTDLSKEVDRNIAVLIEEHIEALDLANEMHKAIREYHRGAPEGRDKILKSVDEYLKIMKPHFKMEEDDVFPSLVKVLSQEEKDKMKADFDRFDEILGGKEVHERYHQIVEELEQQFM